MPHDRALVSGRPQLLPPRARWTPEERLSDMDSLGVEMHVVSPYVGFYNYHLDAKTAVATAREIPDCAGMIAAVEAVTGHTVETIVGKPSRIILDVSLAALGVSAGECVIVGPRELSRSQAALSPSSGVASSP
jgi:hypothetical protein